MGWRNVLGDRSSLAYLLSLFLDSLKVSVSLLLSSLQLLLDVDAHVLDLLGLLFSGLLDDLVDLIEMGLDLLECLLLDFHALLGAGGQLLLLCPELGLSTFSDLLPKMSHFVKFVGDLLGVLDLGLDELLPQLVSLVEPGLSLSLDPQNSLLFQVALPFLDLDQSLIGKVFHSLGQLFLPKIFGFFELEFDVLERDLRLLLKSGLQESLGDWRRPGRRGWLDLDLDDLWSLLVHHQCKLFGLLIIKSGNQFV